MLFCFYRIFPKNSPVAWNNIFSLYTPVPDLVTCHPNGYEYVLFDHYLLHSSLGYYHFTFLLHVLIKENGLELN